MNSSVGNPPGTTCSGVCACATACAQRRQAYFGRRVTSTRNCAGITSSRSDRRRGNDPPDRFLTLLPFADPCHLTAAAGTMCAGGLDHPLDPGQMTAVSPGLAGRFHALPPQRCLGPFQRSLEHALGQFGIFQGQVELVWRQLLGALTKPLALRCAQDIFEPTIGLLHFGQRRLDLGQAGFQQGVFAGKIDGIHGTK